MTHTRNALPAAAREAVIPLLNQHLADLIDLWSHAKHAHWNVKGPHFIQLHQLFDDLAEELDEHADTVAERAMALGGHVPGTARAVAKASRLPELPDDTDGLALTAALADRFAAVADTSRAAVRAAAEAGDDATADLFTGLARDLDKNMWFLEAHLKGR